MKSLIIASINVAGLSMGSRAITLFNDPTVEQKSSSKYFNLSGLCGNTHRVSFLYIDAGVTKHAFHNVTIPADLTETQVKNFIVHEIQEKLKA